MLERRGLKHQQIPQYRVDSFSVGNASMYMYVCYVRQPRSGANAQLLCSSERGQLRPGLAMHCPSSPRPVTASDIHMHASMHDYDSVVYVYLHAE